MAPERQAGLVLEEALAPLWGCQGARHPRPVNWMGLAQFRGHSSKAKDPGGVSGALGREPPTTPLTCSQ